MSRKKHSGGSRKSGIRRAIRKVASGTAALLVAGPIAVPIATTLGAVMKGGPIENAPNYFVFDLIGYDIPQNKLNQAKLGQVIVRDGIMIGSGLVLRWASKKI